MLVVAEYLHDHRQFLEHFFAEPDAEFFKSLGLNCIRIAINYRHFEDDDNPGVLKSEGFKHLDRVVEACAKHNIYTILDLHCLPGGQVNLISTSSTKRRSHLTSNFLFFLFPSGGISVNG